MRPVLFLFCVTAAAQPPEAVITTGKVTASLYLPDPANGHYRGTRFDWSGAINRLKANGHEYFGKWFDKYHPQIHDAITGPVEEFRPVGYEQAKVRKLFLRSGVCAVFDQQPTGPDHVVRLGAQLVPCEGIRDDAGYVEKIQSVTVANYRSANPYLESCRE